MTPADLTDDERDDYEERAAIMEHDGGMPRAQAEAEALRVVIGKRKGQRRLC